MSSVRFKLGLSWIDRGQTLGEFVDAIVRYVEQLRPMLPLFSGPLFLIGRSAKDTEAIAPDLSNIEPFVRRLGWDKKADERWLTGVLPDGTMSREGTSEVGFSCNFNSCGRTTKPTCVYVLVRGGKPGADSPNVVLIDFPSEGWPEFERLDFVKRLMDATVRCFEPEFAYVTSSEFQNAFEARANAGNLTNRESVGWLNYFSNPAVRRDVPPDIECETFGPGGVLLTLQHERPSSEDANALARAVAIRQALHPGQWFDFEKLRKDGDSQRASEAAR
jgi:Immunity protein 52